MTETIDPTSPRGMSNIARRGELTRDSAINGLDPVTISSLTTAQLIEAVVQSRLKKEAHTKEQAIMAAHDGESVGVVEEALHDVLTYEGAKPGRGTPYDQPDSDPESLFIGLPGVKDYIFDGHAGTGPSGAERWMTCTASLAATRAFLETLTPNQQREFANANLAARQGTTAHAAAEAEALVVLGRLSPEEAEATLLELTIMPDEAGEAYDDEMAEYITEYVDLIQSYAHTRGHDHVLIEERVEAVIELMTVDADGEPNVYTIPGSADCIVMPVPEEPTLVVADLKYGEGVDVEVEENPQTMIYAIGALGKLVDDEGNMLIDVEKVILHIAQPRLGGIKTWEISVDDLLTWRDEVLSPALTEALGGTRSGAKFAPSEVACQWCVNRGACPALVEQRLESAAELFDAVTQAEFENGPGSFPETDTLSDEELGKLLAQVNGLTSLRDEMKAEVQRRLYRGTQVPGWQLVNYTPPRKWKADAADELNIGYGDDGSRLTVKEAEALWTEPQLVSPTAAEKILGKEGYPKIEDLVDKPDKRPVAAPEGDRRKTWEGRPPEAMFDIEDDAEEEDVA